VVPKSERAGVDVDYLFLQVFVDQAIVTDAQNCGNILAGVGPFAIERGLVEAAGRETRRGPHLHGEHRPGRGGHGRHAGRARHLRGRRPHRRRAGHGAPVPIVFEDTAGSTCGALLPTGNPVDVDRGLAVTLIDNGMPCVVMRAADLGISGDEAPRTRSQAPTARPLEAIRLAAGPLMNLGDVTRSRCRR
jgi:4-oxalomesaconate tautomerase